jgi:hypothetical protein
MVRTVQFNMPTQRRVKHDRHTALHDAGNQHPICRRCGGAGQLAVVTSNISTYAPSHRGQSIDWPGGRDFAQSGARFRLILVAAERVRTNAERRSTTAV